MPNRFGGPPIIMSILNQLRAGLDQAWEALGDALVPVTYRSVSRGAYNPATGSVSQTETSTPITAALIDYKAEQRGGGSDIRTGDRRAIVRAKDLAKRAQSGDQILEADGTRWTVVSVEGDPRVYFDLQIRQ